MLKTLLVVALFFLFGFTIPAQTIHRIYSAVRTFENIVIDGVPNDSAWKKAPLATDFLEFRPNIGMK